MVRPLGAGEFGLRENSLNVFGLMAPKQTVFPSYLLRIKHDKCFLATSCKISANWW